MSYYEDVYKKRLNRFGLDFQSRVYNQRVKEFETYLLRSAFRVDFEYDNRSIPGSLERNKQDDTQTSAYLLTRVSDKLPAGTIVDITNEDGTVRHWMIFWLQQIESSGYNKYFVLEMENEAIIDGVTVRGILKKPRDVIYDVIKSFKGHPLYSENDTRYMFITPYNPVIARDKCLEFMKDDITVTFRVDEIDIITTEGVEYVALDPTYERDKSEVPEKGETDSDAEFYWLNGGNDSGNT